MASLHNLEYLRKFVAAYQAADGLADVAAAMNLTTKEVGQIAVQLRKKNVNLKKFRKHILTDEAVQALNEDIASE